VRVVRAGGGGQHGGCGGVVGFIWRVGDGVSRSHKEWVDEVGEGVSRSRFEYDWWGGVFRAIAGAFIGVMHMFGPDWR
jgi:hypothetical protein